MQSVTIAALISLYNLQPHPEGGFFKETYRDAGVIRHDALPKPFTGERNYSTAIYFLLPEGKKSHLHRIRSDEVWHFYLGGPLTLIQISPDGKREQIILGQDIQHGQTVQHVVPKDYWFGAYVNPHAEFSFVGCTVAPGFDFADFELGNRDALLQRYPQAKEDILLLTQ